MPWFSSKTMVRFTTLSISSLGSAIEPATTMSASRQLTQRKFPSAAYPLPI